MTTPTGRFYIEPIPPMQVLRPDKIDDAAFERLLRESYEYLLSEEEYQELRKRCGLGKLIEGEVVENGKAKS